MYGYIHSERTPTDYIKGVNSPLVAPLFPNFDWRNVRPALDLQLVNGFDSNGCVSWAGVQDCEEIINAMLALGMIPDEQVTFLEQNGYLVNGKFVASKKYIWVLSGTTNEGNTFANVANAIHANGLIPESLFPFNPAPGSTWTQNFTQPTAAMLAMGQKFLELFNLNYQYITDTNYPTHLENGPIQIAIPVCSGYNTDTPVQACNQPMQHSVIIDYIDSTSEKEIVDHYNPEIKTLATNYPIPAAMQYVVGIKESMPFTVTLPFDVERISIHGTQGIFLAAPTPEVDADLCATWGKDPLKFDKQV